MSEQNKQDCGIDFVDLVEACRQAQRIYFEIVMDRDRRFSQHQERRALQAAKALEMRVDAWIEQYRKERAMLQKWTAASKTDELPGLYETE